MTARRIVYRGTDPVELSLLEDKLRAEGIAVVRLGRATPALLGAGDSAFVQMLEVPDVDSARARQVIGALRLVEAPSKVELEPPPPLRWLPFIGVMLIALPGSAIAIYRFTGSPVWSALLTLGLWAALASWRWRHHAATVARYRRLRARQAEVDAPGSPA